MNGRIGALVLVLCAVSMPARAGCSLEGSALQDWLNGWLACEDCSLTVINSVLSDPGYIACLDEALQSDLVASPESLTISDDADVSYDLVTDYVRRNPEVLKRFDSPSERSAYSARARENYGNLRRQRAVSALLEYPLQNSRQSLIAAKEVLRKLPDSPGSAALMERIDRRLQMKE